MRVLNQSMKERKLSYTVIYDNKKVTKFLKNTNKWIKDNDKSNIKGKLNAPIIQDYRIMVMISPNILKETPRSLNLSLTKPTMAGD